VTDDEQEALSFRYVAPRIMVLSSGNIAICPMLGREPPRIVTPEQFALEWHNLLPTLEQLDLVHQLADKAMRARMATLAPKRMTPPSHKATLDDLA
jgi:hypothetical protein